MLQFYFDTEKTGHKRFELPGAKPHYNPDRPGQVEHIFLDISLDIPNQSCYGSCSIRLLPVRNGIDRLTLDAVNLKITSVQVNEVEQKFEYDGEKLCIYLSQPTEIGHRLLIAIAYTAEAAKLGKNWQIVEYPEPKTLETELILRFLKSQILTSSKDPLAAQWLTFKKELEKLGNFNDPQGIYTILPFTLDIK
jgi:aminopeptidase N